MITRKRLLGLAGSALLLPGCGFDSGSVRIGSTSKTENAIIADIYAIALERAHVPVARRINLGSDAQARDAVERGDIDLFPATGGTRTPAAAVALAHSGAYDSPCLVTSQYFAEKYWLLGLAECSRLAPQLRLAGARDFLASGALDGLRRLYGGFEFQSVTACEPGTQTYVVAREGAEVANATTTSPHLAEENLVILADDKQFWPHRYFTPIVRAAVILKYPDIPSILDPLSKRITQYALQQMNLHQTLLDLEPYDVASDFVDRESAHGR